MSEISEMTKMLIVIGSICMFGIFSCILSTVRQTAVNKFMLSTKFVQNSLFNDDLIGVLKQYNDFWNDNVLYYTWHHHIKKQLRFSPIKGTLHTVIQNSFSYDRPVYMSINQYDKTDCVDVTVIQYLDNEPEITIKCRCSVSS